MAPTFTGRPETVPRTAVVVARPGPTGADETLRTLERLVEAWEGLQDWDVVLVADPDPALRGMAAALEGDVVVRWDVDAVEGEVAAARGRDREVHVLLAGDAPPPVSDGGPLLVPLVDDMFGGESGSSFAADRDGAGLMRWARDFDPSMRQPLVVFTNTSLARVLQFRAARRVAWLLESPEVYPETVRLVVDNPHLFDLVVTSDATLAARLPRAVHVPVAGCWISPDRQAVGDKQSWCSMIASKKGVTSGHHVRLRTAAEAVRLGVDVFGRGFNGVDGFGELAEKADGIVPYRYSIAIENCRVPGYFSEKVVDCFRAGTVPIYWGDPRITDVFVPEGMLLLQDEAALPEVLARATPEHYESVRPAVEENFRRAARYRVVEDRLFPHFRPLVAPA